MLIRDAFYGIWLPVVNKTPVAINKEGAFGETYFRDICSGNNRKWYRKWSKEFDEL